MSTCFRCLAKLSVKPSSLNAPKIAAFSTSCPRQAGKPPQRGKSTLRLGKKRREAKGKVPRVGERKEMRKRIVLSNTNALEVAGLREWDNAKHAAEEAIGSMAALSGPLVDSLRMLDSFKPCQGWSHFRRPATLIRKETVEMVKFIEQVQSGDKKTMNRIVVGERGVGKSVLLLQAQAAALKAGWIVMHIPESQELTTATTEYGPLKDSNPQKFVQNTYVTQLLAKTAQANQQVISQMTCNERHILAIPLQDNTSLDRLAVLPENNSTLAWPVFLAFWKEITSAGRPPILFTVDSMAHLTRLSHYLTPDMYNIHSFDLALVDHFISHLTGAQTLPNGGMILGADSASNRPINPSFDLAVRQRERAGQNVSKLPLYDEEAPFTKFDKRVLESIREVEVVRVPGLTKSEARAILEYYAASGALRQKVTDGLVAERWVASGGGIIGELERASVNTITS